MRPDAGVVHLDGEAQPNKSSGSSLKAAASSKATAALSTVKSTVAGPESEMRRWRRTFESNAKEVNGEL